MDQQWASRVSSGLDEAFYYLEQVWVVVGDTDLTMSIENTWIDQDSNFRLDRCECSCTYYRVCTKIGVGRRKTLSYG